MVVYIQCSDLARRRDRVERDIAGRLAMYRLLAAQQEHCGVDPSEARRIVADALADLEAQRAAPPGTVLLKRASAGAADEIWILAEDKRQIYAGPLAEYRPVGA